MLPAYLCGLPYVHVRRETQSLFLFNDHFVILLQSIFFSEIIAAGGSRHFHCASRRFLNSKIGENHNKIKFLNWHKMSRCIIFEFVV